MIPEYLDIPIFPLPNVTFFPKTLLPLHVFEPRYRAMIASAIKGDKMLAVALLREGWQKDYFGRPPVYKTFGVGKIVDHEHLDDDCYNIMVEGMYRGRLVNEHDTAPYRTGRVFVVQDGPIDHLQSQISTLQKELYEACRQLCDLMPEYRETVRGAWTMHPHPAVTTDLLSSSLVIDAYDRQSILEEPDPIRRIKLLLIQVRQIVFQLSHKAVEEEVFEED